MDVLRRHHDKCELKPDLYERNIPVSSDGKTKTVFLTKVASILVALESVRNHRIE